MVDYRRLWRKYHGAIPLDELGRRYDIHHKDGNRENNEIENLMCISMQEHMELHINQGDWAAAFRIAQRMGISPAIKSELMSQSNKKRLAAGTHPFQQPELRKLVMERLTKLVAAGEHPFQKPEVIQKAVETKFKKYCHEELSQQTKLGWARWREKNPDPTTRTRQGSRVGADRVRGTMWYHKPNGTHLRTNADNPRIRKGGWIRGRFKPKNNNNEIK